MNSGLTREFPSFCTLTIHPAYTSSRLHLGRHTEPPDVRSSAARCHWRPVASAKRCGPFGRSFGRAGDATPARRAPISRPRH